MSSAVKKIEGMDLSGMRGVELAWGSKTQGLDYHIPLLAIGCLLETRFPDAVAVSGDITLSQCRKAVDWANQFLSKSIMVPVAGVWNACTSVWPAWGGKKTGYMRLGN